MQKILSEACVAAIRDYELLLAKGYPQKRTLRFVADHHRLDRLQRTVLYRGLRPPHESRTIRACLRRDSELYRRLVLRQADEDGNTGAAGRHAETAADGASIYTDLYIDTLNILHTIANYLFGRPVFLATDGFLRDCGEAFPHPITCESIPDSALAAFAHFFAETEKPSITCFIDAPVEGSAVLEERLRAALRAAYDESPAWIHVERVISADHAIRTVQSGFIASADTTLVSRGVESDQLRLIDLADEILRKTYRYTPIDLRSFLPE